MSVAALRQRPAWALLEAHHQQMKGLHLGRLFAEDPGRGERLTAEAAGVYLDYSKNRITDETLKLLLQLAEQSGLRERIDAMFRGDKINVSEKRSVLHVALRAPRDAAVLHDGRNVVPEVYAVLEKSGQDEFDFEYGEDFARHIEAFEPTFCKVLVRYNPEADRAMNERQAARLHRLSAYLAKRNGSRFMFELLVPAEKAQLERLKGDKQAYDRELRPQLMARTITELQRAGVEPDIWKIEGLDRPEDCREIVAVARAGGRDRVGCLVLGRGENDQKVREWLATAARVPGFIGFAVGRTVFWEPLVDRTR